MKKIKLNVKEVIKTALPPLRPNKGIAKKEITEAEFLNKERVEKKVISSEDETTIVGE